MSEQMTKAEDLVPGMRIAVNAAWQHTRHGVVLSVKSDGENVEVETTDPMCRDEAALGVRVAERRNTLYFHTGQLVQVYHEESH